MNCPKCGSALEDNAVLCSCCGAIVAAKAKPNRRKRRRKAGVRVLSAVAWVLVLSAFIVGVTSPLAAGTTMVFAVGVLLLALSRFLNHREARRHPVGDAEKALAKRLSHETNETVRMVAKAVPPRRLALTVGFAALLYIVLAGFYEKYFLIPLLAVLVLTYQALLLRCNTFAVLCKAMKKQPDTAAVDIVPEETYNEVDEPRIVKTVLIGAAAVVLAVGAFVYTHLDSRFVTEPVDGGVCLVRYEPGLRQLNEPVEIPRELHGQAVVALGENAFYGNIYVPSIVLPDTVTAIGERAFCDCRLVERMRLPSGLTSLGEGVFENCCSLLSVNIPEGITAIPQAAFDGCDKLQTVDWHDGLTAIGAYAFRNCDAVVEVGFPDGVAEMADYVFADCDSLQSVYIPRGATRIGRYAFNNCPDLTYVFVPDTVTEIGDEAFTECDSLQELALPKNVTVHEQAIDREVTTVSEKPFTDEIADKIDKEFADTTFEAVYVVYNLGAGTEAIYSPEYNGSITVSHTEEFAERLTESMGLLKFDTPIKFKEYLQKAREEGIVNVMMAFDSKVAAEAAGTRYFATYNFDIEALIQSYEENPNEF